MELKKTQQPYSALYRLRFPKQFWSGLQKLFSKIKLKKIRLIFTISALDVIKKITEIVALIIAATWAVYNFQLKDAPILEKSMASRCELQIDSMNKNKNILKYVLHMKNKGRTSFDVDSVRISYWLIPVDTMMRNGYFSATDYADRTAPDYTMKDQSFSYHYVPDKECVERYLFFLDKKPDCGILIKAKFFLVGEKRFFGKEQEFLTDDTYSFKIHYVRGGQ